MWWCNWLRHCATSWKVVCSIHNGVNGIFHWHNSSGHNMALQVTQPLIEMNTMNISWGVKEISAQGWQPYHRHVSNVFKSGSLNLLEPSEPVQACNGIALPLPFILSPTVPVSIHRSVWSSDLIHWLWKTGVPKEKLATVLLSQPQIPRTDTVLVQWEASVQMPKLHHGQDPVQYCTTFYN